MHFESPKSDTKRERYDQNTESCTETKLRAREGNFRYLIQTLLENNLDVNFDLISSYKYKIWMTMKGSLSRLFIHNSFIKSIKNKGSIAIYWERRSSHSKELKFNYIKFWRIQLWTWRSTSFVFFHNPGDIFLLFFL